MLALQDLLMIVITVVPIFALVCFVIVVTLKVMWISARSGREARCALCGSRDVRPSWNIGLMDRIYGLFKCVPYRCRSCRIRFYRRETAVEPDTEPDE